MSTPSEPHERVADDFVPTDELVRRQEGRPFRSLDVVCAARYRGWWWFGRPSEEAVCA